MTIDSFFAIASTARQCCLRLSFCCRYHCLSFSTRFLNIPVSSPLLEYLGQLRVGGGQERQGHFFVLVVVEQNKTKKSGEFRGQHLEND